MLGQDQAGGLDSARSFQGFLSNLNVWDYVLCQGIITRMSKGRLLGEGNVPKWSYFKHGVEGDPRLFIPSPCSSTGKLLVLYDSGRLNMPMLRGDSFRSLHIIKFYLKRAPNDLLAS